MSAEENIIRSEAREFYDLTLADSPNNIVINDFHKVKSRLGDFYSPENKSIFLDEIQSLIVHDLINHRNKKHDGHASPNCVYEINAEKLNFYIRQEIDMLPKVVHQKFSSKPGSVRNKVFVCYSHLDKEYLVDIKRHFKPFLDKINLWDDTKIQPGQKWKEEIRKSIDETKVGILLVSTDFLGSDFIATNELPPLLKAAEEEGAVILILIIKPCLFEEFPDLSQYQAMNPPDNTILKMGYEEKEELFVNLVRQTKKILNEET